MGMMMLLLRKLINKLTNLFRIHEIIRIFIENEKTLQMTINQALDQLTQSTNLNLEQQDLRLSLQEFKVKFGGRTMIENCEQIKNIIEYGNKEGDLYEDNL